MKNVFIVGNAYAGYFIDMFQRRGYNIVKTMEEADIVQFTGGEDIAPEFYGQHRHPSVYTSRSRDNMEKAAYEKAQQLGKFCAGVCRGGQLLNAFAGGSMYQDVKGHATGAGHMAEDVVTGEQFPVSSLHHQMMIMGQGATLLAKSSEQRSRYKLGMTKLSSKASETVVVDDEVEVEACYYAETKAFCYQPHPEFVSHDHPCREWYFNKLEELLGA